MSSIMSYLEGNQSYMTEVGGYFYTSDKKLVGWEGGGVGKKNISKRTLY